MKHSEILEEAKKHLWDGRGEFMYGKGKYKNICSAVWSFTGYTTLASRGDEITDWINHLLEGHGYYHDWLKAQGIKAPLRHPVKLQSSRHAWVDWMIAEYKKAGK